MKGLTAARRNALHVFTWHSQARYSNETSPGRGLIYWQAADWLVDQGLVVRTADRLELTDAGQDLLADLIAEAAR